MLQSEHNVDLISLDPLICFGVFRRCEARNLEILEGGGKHIYIYIHTSVDPNALNAFTQ